MSETTTRVLPAQRPTPTLPTTPRSLVLAAINGPSRRKRLWEMHDDGLWWDTYGNCRETRRLRDVEILHVEPSLEGGAA